MKAKARKYAVRTSTVALAVMIGIACVGRLASHGMIRLTGSATAERYAVLGTVGVGYVYLSDPTGFAIPYRDRWDEVIDSNASYRTVSEFGTPAVFVSNEVVWTNRQGNPVTVRWWNVSLLPWAALSVLVIGGQLSAIVYRRILAANRAWRERRLVRQYAQDERCPACGYDLRETADRCPECGQAFVRRTVILPAKPGMT